MTAGVCARCVWRLRLFHRSTPTNILICTGFLAHPDGAQTSERSYAQPTSWERPCFHADSARFPLSALLPILDIRYGERSEVPLAILPWRRRLAPLRRGHRKVRESFHC